MANKIVNSKITNVVYSKKNNAYSSTNYCDKSFCYNVTTSLARNIIENKMKGHKKDFLWIKGSPEGDSFADLIFQYKNSVFAVKFREHLNGEKINSDILIDGIPIDEEEECRLFSLDYNYIPCILNVFHEEASESRTTSILPDLYDTDTGKIVDPLTEGSDTPILMSQHEKLVIATKTIVNALSHKHIGVSNYYLQEVFWPFSNIHFCTPKDEYGEIFVVFVDNIEDLDKFDANEFINHKYTESNIKHYVAPVYIGGSNQDIYRNDTLKVSYLEDILIEIPK